MSTRLRIACVAVSVLLCNAASAEDAGQHPRYIHALSDLRAAQWQVDHRRAEDGQIQEDELVTSDETAAAIQAVRRAAVLDDKDINFNPPPDVYLAYEGRLHATVDLLKRARADVARTEDNPSARGPQRLAILHIDAAIHAAERAINGVRGVERRE